MVLPSLNDFLVSIDKFGDDDGGVMLNASARTIVRNVVDAKKQAYDFKINILMFLGHLGGKNKAILQTKLGDSTRYSSSALVWDEKEHLRYTMNFVDLSVDVYLDALLPRIVDLALYSSNRSTKVWSCEMLHALGTSDGMF